MRDITVVYLYLNNHNSPFEQRIPTNQNTKEKKDKNVVLSLQRANMFSLNIFYSVNATSINITIYKILGLEWKQIAYEVPLPIHTIKCIW